MNLIHQLLFFFLFTFQENNLKGVYEFDINKAEKRYVEELQRNIEFTKIHRFIILSIDGKETYEFYLEAQNQIIYSKGTYDTVNDSTFQFTSSSNKAAKLSGHQFFISGSNLFLPFRLIDDYNQPDAVLVLSKNEKRMTRYPWKYKDNNTLRSYVNKIRLDSLGWDDSNYMVSTDSTVDKLGNPKPYLTVNRQPLFDMELDNISIDSVKKVSVLKGDKAKSMYGSVGRNGVIYIELKNE